MLAHLVLGYTHTHGTRMGGRGGATGAGGADVNVSAG